MTGTSISRRTVMAGAMAVAATSAIPAGAAIDAKRTIVWPPRSVHDSIWAANAKAVLRASEAAGVKVISAEMRGKSIWMYSTNKPTEEKMDDMVTLSPDPYGSYDGVITMIVTADGEKKYKIQVDSRPIGETDEDALRIYAGNDTSKTYALMADWLCGIGAPNSLIGVSVPLPVV